MTAAALVVTLFILILGTLRYSRQAEFANAQLQRQGELNAQVRKMEGVLIALGSAESGQRGYLLTGKQSYLAVYEDAVRAMPGLLNIEVDPKVSGLDGRAQAIKRLANLKLAELAETVRLYKEGKRAAALDLVNTDAGQMYMDQARTELNEAVEAIRVDRDKATAAIVAATNATRRTAVATVTALALLTGFAALQILRLTAAQRKFAAELADSERFVRGITNSLPVHVTYFDRDLKIQFINDAQLRRAGRTRDEVLGRRHHEFLDPAVSEGLAQRLSAALNGEAQDFEYVDSTGGSPLIIQAKMLPDFGDEGSVKGVFTTGVDVTALKSTERRLRDLTDILENTPDFIVQTNAKGRVQYMNPAARRQLGFDLTEDLSKRFYSEFNTKETNRRYVGEILPSVGEHGVWTGETTVLRSGGEVVPVNHMVIAHADGDGRVQRYSAIMRDISSTLAARRALSEQTATLEAIVEAIPAMVAVFDDDIHYKLVNRAFERWRGKDRGEVLGRGIAELFGQHEFDRSLPWINRALGGETVNYEKDYPESNSNRHLNISYVPLRLSDGTVRGFIAVAQDITLHRDEERRLLDMAERDALTGALNRAGFHRYLEGLVEGGGASLALLYIDLDKFKPVNDTYGHPAGDNLLCQFADRLKKVIRPADAVARLGGDEFAVVLGGVRTKADADVVADKIVRVSAAPFLLGQHIVTVGASVGVAFGVQDVDSLPRLLVEADAAVYRAKKAGRGQRA